MNSVQTNEFSVCNNPICSWDFVSLKGGDAQIFQKSGSHLKILGAKSVTQSKFPDSDLTNIIWHNTKFSCHGNLALRICKPLIKGKGD